MAKKKLGQPPSMRRKFQQIDEAVYKVQKTIAFVVHTTTTTLRCAMSPNVTDAAIRKMILRAWDEATQGRRGQNILLTGDSQEEVFDLTESFHEILNSHGTGLDMTDPGNLKFARDLVAEQVALSLAGTRANPKFQGRKEQVFIRVIRK